MSHAVASRSDDLFDVTAFFQTGALALAAVLFLVWLHRIVANGPALGGKGLRFTPGWAVGWWFVPFANFVRPYQVVSEGWRTANAPAMESTRDTRSWVKLPMMVPLWWGLWLLGWFLSRMELFTGHDHSAKTLHDAAAIDVASSLALACAGILCMMVVSRLTRSQDRRNSERASMPPQGSVTLPAWSS